MFYHADWPRYRIESQEMWRENPLQTLEKLGCKKYSRAKITRVNMVFVYFWALNVVVTYCVLSLSHYAGLFLVNFFRL
jgi:hypothetical protein